MENPFEIINQRLDVIESLLLEIRQDQMKPQKVKPSVEKLLSVKQAAELLRLSVPTMYSKVSRGELPVMKRGKRLHFSEKELMDYLKAGRKKTNEEIEREAESYLENKKGSVYVHKSFAVK